MAIALSNPTNDPTLKHEVLPVINGQDSPAAAGPGDETHPPEPLLPDDVIEELVDWCRLLADSTRLRIVHFLLQYPELNVRTLCEFLGQSQPAVSHHLALLRVAGMIACRRDGKHNFYHLLPGKFEAVLSRLFRVGPNGSARVPLEKYVLRYSPIEE